MSETPAPTSQTPPPPDLPKPNIPAPHIPKPDVPSPSAPLPSVPVSEPASAAPLSDPGVKIQIGSKVGQQEENVDDTAEFNSRAVGFLIDAVVAMGLMMLAWFILPGALERIGSLLGIAYILTRDSLPFLGGQSIGKKVMGIKAVTKDGATLSGNWQPGVLRNVALAIPFFPIVELVILLTRDNTVARGKRLGDDWAGTRVIKLPPPEPPAEG